MFRTIPFIVLVVSAAALGWWWFEGRGREFAGLRPYRGHAIEAIYATGTVEPLRWAKVSPMQAGRIAQILARDGDAVSVGAVLAKLDDREPRAALAQLAAREKFLREEVDRLRPLRERGVVSQQSFDRAASDLQQANAQTQAARKLLADRTLESPIAGVVLRQDGLIGEVVEAGRVLYWVGPPRPIRIVADVDEQDIPRVKAGQRALIKADAFPDRAIEAKVADITLKGDPVNQTYRVYLSLPDDAPLLIGMTVEVNIVLRETADALLVPQGGLRDGKVWIVKEGVAKAIAVRTGAVGDKAVEIRDGLSGDEVLINAPPRDLKDGTKVRIVAK